MKLSKKQNTQVRMAALLVSAGLVAAACGADTSTDLAADVVDDTSAEVVEEEAMEDEDEEAMEDDEEAMEDDDEAMEDDEEAMEDDEEAMEDDADDETLALADISTNVNLEFEGLEPLGDAFVYEGWVIIDDEPYSTGRFIVDVDGNQEYLSGSAIEDVSEASTFVLTIEPAESDDPAPSTVRLLAGDFVDGEAQLSVGHAAALGTDFSDASGQFILATPTTESTDDEVYGVWFIDIVDGAPVAGLDLPVLSDDWVYEGWVVVDGQAVSTGRFSDPAGPDDFNGFAGDDADAPPFPGEDFIQNAPEGLEFPKNLAESTVVISIEPADDDSPAPFTLKPLLAEIPGDVEGADEVQLDAGLVLTGEATLG